MMYRYAATLVALIALSCAIAPGVSLGAQSPGDKLAAEQSARQTVENLTGQPYWECETTQASGLHLWEYDTFDKIGDFWVHGSARPVQGETGPFYDLYLGYDHVHSHWVYIQIAPAIGTYFVALSDGVALDGSWRIVYPWELAGYKVIKHPNSLFIQYPDLQQACKTVLAVPTANPAPSPTPTPSVLTCKTWYSPDGYPDDYGSAETLTISEPQNRTKWWQGVAKIGDDKVYAYNIFNVKTETGPWRISILVNGKTGVFAIAKSYELPNLNNSAWVVQYPSVRPGFAFKDVTYQGDLPTALTLIFRDGFQRCALSPNTPQMP
jgi:hypothetical protein